MKTRKTKKTKKDKKFKKDKIDKKHLNLLRANFVTEQKSKYPI